MSDRLVTLADVALGYDGRRILEHVSFAVERGEFIALLGPNGGGKTTLLRGILRLVPVLAGDIAYGFDRRVHPPGYVPQKERLDPTFDCSTTHRLAGHLPCPDIDEATIHRYLQFGEEADRLNRMVGELLDFSRPNEPNLQPEPLREMVDEAIGAATASAASPGVEVRREIADGLPRAIVDARLVHRALVNLVYGGRKNLKTLSIGGRHIQSEAVASLTKAKA